MTVEEALDAMRSGAPVTARSRSVSSDNEARRYAFISAVCYRRDPFTGDVYSSVEVLDRAGAAYIYRPEDVRKTGGEEEDQDG